MSLSELIQECTKEGIELRFEGLSYYGCGSSAIAIHGFTKRFGTTQVVDRRDLENSALAQDALAYTVSRVRDILRRSNDTTPVR